MLDQLNNYALMIASLAVLCALFECLIPEGKLKKMVLFSIGILFLLGIVSPLLNMKNISLPEITLPDSAQQGTGTETYDGLLRGYYDSIINE